MFYFVYSDKQNILIIHQQHKLEEEEDQQKVLTETIKVNKNGGMYA